MNFSPNRKAKIRLFCFHYAGGGPSVFKLWHNYFDESVDIMCVQLPGRESRFRDPLLSNIQELIDQLVKAISQYTELPFVFFGHSIGALISHQLYYALAEAGLPRPVRFIASGRPAPSDTRVYFDKITHLSDYDFLDALKEYNGMSDELLMNKEIMDIYLPILRSDFSLAENPPQIKTKLTCPIDVFGGISDAIPEERLQLWKNETNQSCKVHMFQGDHFFLNENRISVVARMKELIRLTDLAQHI